MAESASPPVRPRSLSAARGAAQECRACELYKGATQTVFGEGRPSARLMLVGEQPGDREDREGRPFVGPAGALLDRALERAGIARPDVYVTNVVKHFKYRLRGTRRIHQRPGAIEISACRPWLDAELALVAPEALVCLGATAGQALLGRHIRIGRDRGRLLDSDLAPAVLLTTHPSAVLRERDSAAREAALNELVGDLRLVASHASAARSR
jgi:uracil-DNA glycosylase